MTQKWRFDVPNLGPFIPNLGSPISTLFLIFSKTISRLGYNKGKEGNFWSDYGTINNYLKWTSNIDVGKVKTKIIVIQDCQNACLIIFGVI